MSSTISIIEDNTDKALAELKSIMPALLEEIGLQGETNAKLEVTKAVYDTPPAKSGYVRTGTLRNKLTHRKDRDSAYIGTNTEYAPYVELGTSRMKARPFIKPAVQNHISEYKAIIEKYLKG